jgi:hypothetical protein
LTIAFAFSTPEWLRAILPPHLLERFSELPLGFWIATGTLFVCVVLGWSAAVGMLGAHFEPLLVTRTGRRSKKDGGLKYFFLLLIALLPGGLIGTAAVAVLVGRKQWRRDAAYIQFVALVPALPLGLLTWSGFPWPWIADNLWLNGTLGLTFALLQFWATLKLLREAWGEPEQKVPWWPPLALFVQTLLFADIVLALGRP